jgi:hypothetical protein
LLHQTARRRADRQPVDAVGLDGLLHLDELAGGLGQFFAPELVRLGFGLGQCRLGFLQGFVRGRQLAFAHFQQHA